MKITDFGLAKLLDFNEDEFRAGGGKVGDKYNSQTLEFKTGSGWNGQSSLKMSQ